MAAKFGTKSKIPVKNPRKELLPETVGIAFGKSNQPKPMGIKENKDKTKTVKKEVDVKNKKSGEVKQPKAGNTEKVTTKENTSSTKRAPKQRATGQSVARSAIEIVSKEIANHLKAEQLPDCKSSTEVDANGGNVISKKSDETKRKPGEKAATSPSLTLQPKMQVPYSGLMFKPPVKKSTVVFKPFSFHPNRPQLRRSRSEYDPDFERPAAQNIQLQQRNKISVENYTTHQKMKTAKSSTISKNKELSTDVENKIRKETPQVHPRKPLVPSRITKTLPVENKAAKPPASKPKPLRRSNTVHVFDSVPLLKKSTGAQKREPIPSNRITEKVKSENKDPVTPENSKSPQLVVDEEFLKDHITPKKEVPHGGILFKLHAAKKGNVKKFNPFSNVGLTQDIRKN